MATFHRMQDESGKDVVRAFVKGAPDQLLARSASHPRRRPEAGRPRRRRSASRYNGENERLAEQGLRVMATGRKDFDAEAFDAELRPARC